MTVLQHELIGLGCPGGPCSMTVYVVEGEQFVPLQRCFHEFQVWLYIPVAQLRAQIDVYLIGL